MQGGPVDAALLPFFYSKLCWAMIKGCQGFNLKPWQLEGVICMFAWQCDRVISGDNAHTIHSGTAVPTSIKCDGGRGRGITSVAAGIMSKKLSYFFLLEGQETYRCMWIILLIHHIKILDSRTPSRYTTWKTPQTFPFPLICISSLMSKVAIENSSYYWSNFLLKWLSEKTFWRGTETKVVEHETKTFGFSFKISLELWLCCLCLCCAMEVVLSDCFG